MAYSGFHDGVIIAFSKLLVAYSTSAVQFLSGPELALVCFGALLTCRLGRLFVEGGQVDS
jgi:hypothetical protein